MKTYTYLLCSRHVGGKQVTKFRSPSLSKVYFVHGCLYKENKPKVRLNIT